MRVAPKSHGRRADMRVRPWPASVRTREADRDRPASTPTGARSLTAALVLLDGGAVAIVWSIVLLFLVPDMSWVDAVAIVIGVTVADVVLARAHRLYQSRACALRSEEKARLLRVVVADAVVVLALANVTDVELPVSAVAWGSVFAFLVLAAFRSAFRQWLNLSRARGRHLRPIVVVGDNDESATLVSLLLEQPELGFEVLGYAGRPPGEPHHDRSCGRRLGPTTSAVEIATQLGATGLLIVVTALDAQEIDELTRAGLAAGLHVHVSTGLQGVTPNRLRVLPISYEPLLYVEAVRPSRYALAVKRLLDVVLASLALLVALPVLACAAVLVKLGDRGPVLFRQQRVGRHGDLFVFYKLRTMTPGSDAKLDEVWDRNTRRDSPLFKDPSDPRRTRVGRVLEATSIDELPQLWNVLRGDMSLVGPRPALPHEVAQFDDELLRRHSVRPGITGLWQVEGRDNPHFSQYRRLDLVYVENFSLALDAVILSLTAQIVLARAAAKLLGWDRESPDAAPPGASLALPALVVEDVDARAPDHATR